MANQFDRFSDRAMQILTFAMEESQALGHQHIDSGHLLLGASRLKDGLSRELLSADGVTREGIQGQIEAAANATCARAGAAIGLTGGGKRVIKLAIGEARRSGVSGIDAEHLLLGILRQPEGAGTKALREIGADLPKLAGALERHLFIEDGGAPRAVTVTEALDLASQNLGRRGRTPLVAGSEARALAISSLAEARDALLGVEVSGYAELIGTEVIRPDIDFVIEALEAGATTLPEFLERVGRVRQLRITLGRLARVHEQVDYRRLAGAARKAAAALAAAIPLF